MDVKLNRVDPGDFPGILDVNTHSSLALLGNLQGLNVKVAVLKVRVAQPITERVEWCAGHVDVSPIVDPALLDPISLRGLIVVIDR